MSHIITQNDDILSYGYLLKSIASFKSSGGRSGDEFNKFDTPSHLFFKPVFYFQNGDSDRPDNEFKSGGLLAPTWLNNVTSSFYQYNSAWSYLKLNHEIERADKLRQFVELLSNINMYSPWYFQSIEGLNEVRTRPINDMKIEEERKKITIKCLQDSYDDRIGTLLDLYRDVTWSWIHKREVIPANLRKFDMGIYIFSSPVTNMHDPGNKMEYKLNYGNNPGRFDELLKNKDKNENKTINLKRETNIASVNPESSSYITSYKYLEFHNCEINYNSAATGYEMLDNVEGISPTYSIEIFYDDCYETRYNEFMMKTIGDMIKWDLSADYGTTQVYDEDDENYDEMADYENEMNQYGETEEKKKKRLGENRRDERINLYEGNNNSMIHNEENIYGKKKKYITGMLGEVIGAIKDRAEEFLTSKFLGNIYGFSLEQGIQDIKNLSKGKFFATADAIDRYIESARSKNLPKFQDSNIRGPKQNKKYYLEQSNIFKNKTIESNI